jgi:hypothetical protein
LETKNTMWPAIANYADDYTERLEQRTRVSAHQVAQPRNRWMVRSLRGTGVRLARLADRLEAPRAGVEAY